MTQKGLVIPELRCLSACTQAEAEDEPLALSQVVVEEGPRAALERAWAARRQHSMYGSGEEYLQLVTQVGAAGGAARVGRTECEA